MRLRDVTAVKARCQRFLSFEFVKSGLFRVDAVGPSTQLVIPLKPVPHQRQTICGSGDQFTGGLVVVLPLLVVVLPLLVVVLPLLVIAPPDVILDGCEQVVLSDALVSTDSLTLARNSRCAPIRMRPRRCGRSSDSRSHSIRTRVPTACSRRNVSAERRRNRPQSSLAPSRTPARRPALRAASRESSSSRPSSGGRRCRRGASQSAVDPFWNFNSSWPASSP